MGHYTTNLVTILIVPTLKLLGMKSHYKRVKIQSVLKKVFGKVFHFLKKNGNISFLGKEIYLSSKCYKFGSLTSNLDKTRLIRHVFARNEFSKKKYYSALRIKILIVKVC